VVCLEITTLLPISCEQAFDLSLDVDLHMSSMAQSKERAIAGVTSGRMALGDEVTWRAWHFGVPWRMTSRITEYDRPRWFVDEQSRGPFARFRHDHLFEGADGGTRMLDRIEFAAPLGWLGLAVERLVLTRYLTGLIKERNLYLGAPATSR